VLCHFCLSVVFFLCRSFVLTGLQMPAFTAAIVLLLNISARKRSGLTTDPVKEMGDVHQCMNVLKACEGR